MNKSTSGPRKGGVVFKIAPKSRAIPPQPMRTMASVPSSSSRFAPKGASSQAKQGGDKGVKGVTSPDVTMGSLVFERRFKGNEDTNVGPANSASSDTLGGSVGPGGPTASGASPTKAVASLGCGKRLKSPAMSLSSEDACYGDRGSPHSSSSTCTSSSITQQQEQEEEQLPQRGTQRQRQQQQQQQPQSSSSSSSPPRGFQQQQQEQQEQEDRNQSVRRGQRKKYVKKIFSATPTRSSKPRPVRESGTSSRIASSSASHRSSVMLLDKKADDAFWKTISDSMRSPVKQDVAYLDSLVDAQIAGLDRFMQCYLEPGPEGDAVEADLASACFDVPEVPVGMTAMLRSRNLPPVGIIPAERPGTVSVSRVAAARGSVDDFIGADLVVASQDHSWRRAMHMIQEGDLHVSARDANRDFPKEWGEAARQSYMRLLSHQQLVEPALQRAANLRPDPPAPTPVLNHFSLKLHEEHPDMLPDHVRKKRDKVNVYSATLGARGRFYRDAWDEAEFLRKQAGCESMGVVSDWRTLLPAYHDDHDGCYQEWLISSTNDHNHSRRHRVSTREPQYVFRPTPPVPIAVHHPAAWYVGKRPPMPMPVDEPDKSDSSLSSSSLSSSSSSACPWETMHPGSVAPAAPLKPTALARTSRRGAACGALKDVDEMDIALEQTKSLLSVQEAENVALLCVLRKMALRQEGVEEVRAQCRRLQGAVEGACDAMLSGASFTFNSASKVTMPWAMAQARSDVASSSSGNDAFKKRTRGQSAQGTIAVATGTVGTIGACAAAHVKHACFVNNVRVGDTVHVQLHESAHSRGVRVARVVGIRRDGDIIRIVKVLPIGGTAGDAQWIFVEDGLLTPPTTTATESLQDNKLIALNNEFLERRAQGAKEAEESREVKEATQAPLASVAMEVEVEVEVEQEQQQQQQLEQEQQELKRRKHEAASDETLETLSWAPQMPPTPLDHRFDPATPAVPAAPAAVSTVNEAQQPQPLPLQLPLPVTFVTSSSSNSLSVDDTYRTTETPTNTTHTTEASESPQSATSASSSSPTTTGSDLPLPLTCYKHAGGVAGAVVAAEVEETEEAAAATPAPTPTFATNTM